MILFDKHLSDHSVNTEENEKNKIFQDDEKNEHYRDYLERVQQRLFASCPFLGIREALAMLGEL